MQISGNIIENLELLITATKGFIWILENDHGYDLKVTKDFIKQLQDTYGIVAK